MSSGTNRSPADRAIALLGCAGGTVTLAIVAITSAVTHASAFWIVLGSVGFLVLSAVAAHCLRLVRRHGFFYEPADDEDEDEDGSPEGGTGNRFPPDAPDGDGSLEFDWDGFLAGFWEHVEASGRQSERELALQ
ncbi:MAG TPA: hypothetical protein VG223_14725 [Solirubrobacteraceae bacterium]|nr:hypothetical protein [Solirubrobacteraceae bacterium]